MNKVLFGIFLGILFNVPTFGMNNNLEQSDSNSLVKDGTQEKSIQYDEYSENGFNNENGGNGQSAAWIADEHGFIPEYNFNINTQYQNESIDNNNIQDDQNYDTQYYDYLYGNMEGEPISGNIIFVESNIQDIVCNIDQNYSSNNNNNEGIYINNDTQFRQNHDMNDDLSTSKKLTIDKFRGKYKKILKGQIEQLPKGIEKLVEQFCKDFDEFNTDEKNEIIKNDIKCDTCGGELRLAGRDNNQRQRVCCVKTNKYELLEAILYVPYIKSIVNSFKERYKWLFEENEQVKEEDIKGFCEEFYGLNNGLNIYVKRKLIKYIKCSCCKGKLMLNGSSQNGKQRVCCVKTKRYKLLETNLRELYLKKQRL